MKQLLLAGVAFTVLAVTSAIAADAPPSRYTMPPPRAPAYVPFFTWNGFYMGLFAGYGFGQSNWGNTAVTTGNFDIDGATIGGTAGYNIQTGSWVFGLESDIGWSNIKGSSTAAVCGTGCETSSDWLGTLRGRFGYAFDRFLPYVTGGMSFGSINGDIAGTGHFNSTNVGWTAGGGLEYAFVNNWSAKVEYLYMDLGNATCDATCAGGTPFDVNFKANILRGGLNYKF